MASASNWALSVFGLGRLPVAPGTWGSLPAAILFMAVGIGFGSGAAAWTMGFCAVIGIAATIGFSAKAIQEEKNKDPNWIVSDELAGQSLTLLLILPFVSELGFCLLSAIGFGLFRLFDIIKPFPCRQLENLPAGWGIVADDLAAAGWAAAVMVAARHLDSLSALSGWFGNEGHLSIGLAGFLGIVQGLTEFLPVSSSGHLLLLESFVENIQAESPEMLFFDLALHLGTVLAIAVVFGRSFVRFVKSLKSALLQKPYRQWFSNTLSIRLLILATVSTLATGIFYIVFGEFLENARQMRILSGTWLVSAIVLFLSDKIARRKPLRRFGIFQSFWVGISQGIAILPGISRSGATICAGLLLGLPARWAIEFSFLIAIPAILGGTMVHAIKYRHILLNSGLEWSYLLIGFFSAFLSGILALKTLIRLSKYKKLRYFAFYCLVLSLIVFVYTL